MLLSFFDFYVRLVVASELWAAVMEEAQEFGNAFEREEITPLLHKGRSNSPHTQDGSVDVHGRSALRSKTGNWRASCIILGFECLESLAYYGIATNLVTYMYKILHEGNASTASSITTWAGTCFLTPFLGALLADSYWGRYHTVFIFALIYLLGMAILTISASLSPLRPPVCDGGSCPSATEAQRMVFFSGLYLVAFGSGGVKSSLVPFGADQFDDSDALEKQRKASFFNWFYFSLNLGTLISSTVIVWVEENVDWALGYGVATLFMALAVGSFASGTSIYRFQRPNGSPLKRIAQVLFASFRKTNLKVPSESCNLYEVDHKISTILGSERLLHTDGLRFLDKAAIICNSDLQNSNPHNSWKLCPVSQVEELKILIRMFPIWVTCIIYSVSYAQLNTTFVQQGTAMDTKIGSFSVPPASLLAFEVFTVMFWVLTYDTVLKRIVGYNNGFSELQRVGIGQFLMILAMSVAALVEMKRLISAEKGKNMSIAWQLPQYFIMGASEVFNFIGQLEFFYRQAPDTMKGMCTAVSVLSISMGNYLSSFIVAVVAFATTSRGKMGWIPDNLNNGHLDYFFWALAGLNTLNFVLYIKLARNYRLKEVIV